MNEKTREEVLVVFGTIVKTRRVFLNLSQEDLARKCDFDRTYISMLERGKRNITLTNLIILANGLSTSVGVLTFSITTHYLGGSQ